MNTAIVTTTINVPHLLEAYAQNALELGHEETLFIVIGDKKAPPEAKSFCEGLAARYPHKAVFMTIQDQEQYLAAYPELREYLPYNSIQRRNIGMLLAYEKGAEVIITIDDDNYLVDGDFVGRHAIVGTTASLEAFSSSDGWINICDFLTEENGHRFYHRGFPIKARWPKDQQIASSTVRGKVVVNAGLWLEEPDIDAITRLTMPVKVIGFRRDKNFALASGTWSPFNSQNTALSQDVIPAYFLNPNVGRYDDIWASYIIKAIADHLGDLITFGFPLVKQERNPHDYLVDLEKEIEGMRLTDAFCACLRDIRLSGSTYQECYKEIHRNLAEWIEHSSELGDSHKRYLGGYVFGMDVWIKTMGRVMTKGS